ncbi:MAG: holo-ACP synthase [Planctomycetota bacterium]
MAVLGVGTEIVECVRISRMIDTHGEQFLGRVYSVAEIDHCVQRVNATQHFAARWAAKEAAMKAMHCHNQGIRWNQIEVSIDPAQGPMLELSASASDWAAHRGIAQLHLSLGSCRTHATATVIAVDIDG